MRAGRGPLVPSRRHAETKQMLREGGKAMSNVVILASLSTNADPLMRFQTFELMPVAYTSLDEAIRATKLHYTANWGRDTVPEFRVYESGDPDGTVYAIVEVSEMRGSDLTFAALYKIVAGKYGFRKSPEPSAGGSAEQVPQTIQDQRAALRR
jgi:hypothetical protein